jgi:cysteine desulfurase
MVKPRSVYLDYAAATPLDRKVRSAMKPCWSLQFHNPSAIYEAAREVKSALDEARVTAAKCLGARPAEIVFTAGGTEANNLAIRGVMETYPKCNVVVSGIEHESVLAPAQLYECKIAKVSKDGRIDLKDLAKLIDSKTTLISVMYANNEVGTIQPIREVAEIIKKKRAERKDNLPLYFHTDAAQAANYLDLHVSRLGVDMLSLNGGKIYGPKQSGLLFVKAGIKLKPLILGGGQEMGLRSGTENVAGNVGLSVALDIAQQKRHYESQRQAALKQMFMENIKEALPEAIINGSLKHRLPNNVHVTIPGVDNERLLIQLDLAGIEAAAGSACSASSEEPSHVLKAMGITDKAARSSIRFTLGRQTTDKDIQRTIKVLMSLTKDTQLAK